MIDIIIHHLTQELKKVSEWHAHSNTQSVLEDLSYGHFGSISENIFLPIEIRIAAEDKDAYKIMLALGFPNAKPYLERCVEVWMKMTEHDEEVTDLDDLKSWAYDMLGIEYDQDYCPMCQYVKDNIPTYSECRNVCPLMRIWPQGCLAYGSPYLELRNSPSRQKVRDLANLIKDEANFIKGIGGK